MIYKCFFCEANLKIPPEVDLHRQTTPVSLQCPHCKNITTLELTNYQESKQELKLKPRKLYAMYQAVKQSFMKDEIPPPEKDTILRILAGRFLGAIHHRTFTTFILLTLFGQALLFWGLLELSNSYPDTSLIHLIPWGTGIVLSLIFLAVHRYVTGDFVADLLGEREKRFFESILHGSVVIFSYCMFATGFEHMFVLDSLDLNEIEHSRDLYLWLGSYLWIGLLFTLFYTFKERVYIYAIFAAVFVSEFLEISHYIDNRYTLLNIAPTPFLKLIAGDYYSTVAVALYYLIIGPWLGFTILKSVEFFMPNYYKVTFGPKTKLMLNLHYFTIPIFSLYAFHHWEHLAWLIVLGAGSLFLLSQSASLKRHYVFRYGLFAMTMFLITLYSFHDKHSLGRFEMFWMILTAMVFLFLPNAILRFKTRTDLHWENEINTDLPYLHRLDFFLQSLVAIFLLLVGNALFYHHGIYAVVLNIFFLVSGLVLLSINYYRISLLAKFLPWIYIYGSIAAMVYGLEIHAYGVIWFLLSTITVLLSFMWKIYATRAYNHRVYHYLKEAEFPSELVQEYPDEEGLVRIKAQYGQTNKPDYADLI